MSLPQPSLVLDGSARHGVRVGVLAEGRWIGQGVSAEGPLEAVFACAEQALAEAGTRLADVRSFVVCVGPGSVLGIRIACLAVRTWAVLQPRPIFAWHALDALAQSALEEGVTPPFVVAQPSRLKRWNRLAVGLGAVCSDADEVPAGELSSAPLVVSDDPAVSAVSDRTRLLAHPWPRLPGLFARPGFLRQQDKPEALNPATDFAVWSGERHRGPAA